MDRLKAMRQRDWARVFGIACTLGAVALSVAGYAGADWDALILLLGALMLLRGAVEGPSPSRVAGLLRAGRLILLMLAFGAVNRAQGGIEGAVAGVLGNPILWAVAVLLLALPMLRRGLPWQKGEPALVEFALVMLAGGAIWLQFRWIEGAGDMAALRSLVTLAALVNGLSVLRSGLRGVEPALAIWIMLICSVTVPGGAVWPMALACLAVAAPALILIRRYKDTARE